MMNILGFVSAILIIFSIISGFMLKQHVDDAVISKSMKGYYRADLESKTAYETSLYDYQKKIPSADPKPKTDPNVSLQGTSDKQVAKEEEEEKDENNTIIIYECSCLNIFPLIKNDKTEEKQLYELFAKLIKILYPNELSKREMEYALIDTLAAVCKKKYLNKEEICLEKIDLKNPTLQSIWYKMLKGSKGYDFGKKTGIPSILSFIFIKETEKPEKICLSRASKEMLTALFNEKIAEKIWEKRKKSKIKITRNELETILNESQFITSNDPASDIWPSLCFSHKNHKKSPKITICKDDSTQISILRVCRYQ